VNRLLRKIFGPKRNKVILEWGKLHNEELHNFYSSPSVITMIKSRREKRNAYEILVPNQKERHHQKDLGVGG
jgi:hypothetical protein